MELLLHYITRYSQTSNSKTKNLKFARDIYQITLRGTPITLRTDFHPKPKQARKEGQNITQVIQETASSEYCV